MAIKKRGLGKSLNALLFDPFSNEDDIDTGRAELENGGNRVLDKTLASSIPKTVIDTLEVHQLQPGKYQPRREINPVDLESLADSIRAQGVIQPIVVRPLSAKTQGPDAQYEIIAGERRWRAAQLAGLSCVPVVLRNVSDQVAMAMALIENIQREDLNPLEEACAFERLAKEFNLTHGQVAEMVGKSRTTVTNSLRLLTLGEDLKLWLERGDLEVGHAKVLLTVKDPLQTQLARTVVEKGLSVRETERMILNLQNGRSEKLGSTKSKNLDPDIVRLQNSLSDKLGATTQIVHSNLGKGKIVIHYNSLDELDGVLIHLDPSLNQA
jgi:ParB family chromosome partitioning protein